MTQPEQFIPMMEAHGLISGLTQLVIEAALTDMAPRMQRDRNFHLSINISASDLQDGKFLGVLAKMTEERGVDPSQVWLEITERAFVDASVASSVITTARDRGCRVVIDDFGTGYSSLSLLQGLPVDALKIDKSFINAIGHGAAQSVVTANIIRMAHDLELAMIAEGIEADEQEEYLKRHGVQFGQGWRYSKAIPADKFLSDSRCDSAHHLGVGNV